MAPRSQASAATLVRLALLVLLPVAAGAGGFVAGLPLRGGSQHRHRPPRHTAPGHQVVCRRRRRHHLLVGRGALGGHAVLCPHARTLRIAPCTSPSSPTLRVANAANLVGRHATCGVDPYRRWQPPEALALALASRSQARQPSRRSVQGGRGQWLYHLVPQTHPWLGQAQSRSRAHSRQSNHARSRIPTVATLPVLWLSRSLKMRQPLGLSPTLRMLTRATLRRLVVCHPNTLLPLVQPPEPCRTQSPYPVPRRHRVTTALARVTRTCLGPSPGLGRPPRKPRPPLRYSAPHGHLPSSHIAAANGHPRWCDQGPPLRPREAASPLRAVVPPQRDVRWPRMARSEATAAPAATEVASRHGRRPAALLSQCWLRVSFDGVGG